MRPRTALLTAPGDTSAEPVILTSQLSKRYGETHALYGMGLRVERGQVFALLGGNGAGKTTMMRLLMGLQRPTSGHIRLFGVRLPTRRARVFSRIGALIESPSGYGHLTGRENLEVVRRLRRARAADIDEALGLVGLAESADRLVRAYSKGMRQRLGIAMALLGGPELVILDEPTNGLDPEGIRDVRSLIARLPERLKATVFVSSHLLHEVEQLATHVAVIRRGRLLFQGPLPGLLSCAEPKIAIGVDRPWQAKDVLAAQRFHVVTVSGTHVEVQSAPSRVPEIVRLLGEAGFTITRLCTEGPSLEELYFRLTADREGVSCP